MTQDAAFAADAVKGLAHNAMITTQFSESPFGELGFTEMLDAIEETASTIQGGALHDVEALLVSQAVALNAIFTSLALRAKTNMGEHLDATDRYLRLALKAQSQCRATVETLALMKNPPIVFARQANIAHGHQQVNNGSPISSAETRARAGNQETEPIKLLEEAHGERLDTRATGAAGGGDQKLAAVGTRDRPSNERR